MLAKSFKLDLHVHSKFRGKVYINAEELRKSLIKRQLNGAAITNFFDISHAVSLKEELKEFIIIVGQEVWTNDGHIIGLNLDKKIPDFKSAEETIKEIHNHGGIAIAPHPYLNLGVGEKAMTLPFDAVESYNGLIGASFIFNFLAGIKAQKNRIPQTASTDTTSPAMVGRSYTEVMVGPVKNRISNGADDESLIFDAIRSGNVKLRKQALPLPIGFILKNFLNFKNIKPCLLHAVPCPICGASMAVRLFKRKLKCSDCGAVQNSRVLCSNGHFLCLKCVIKKETNNLS